MIDTQTVVAYVVVAFFACFELAALITDAVFISLSTTPCIGDAGKLSLASWGFINSLIGAAFNLFFVWWFSSEICSSENPAKLLCFTNDGAQSRKHRNICFWIVFSIPAVFRLAFCVVGLILINSVKSTCEFYANLYPLMVVQMISIFISITAMVKTALNADLQDY